MIEVSDKSLCCGCSACVQACPVHCITMERDEKGFSYPSVNPDTCIECGKCLRVCPELPELNPLHPLMVLAGINPSEDVRSTSSSGGVFTLLAEKIIDEGGVVCGAAFDAAWKVRHIFVDNSADLVQLRGSKYVQSDTGEAFVTARRILDSGKMLLFSGTGCQIAALKRFLGSDPENLISVEVACHGVPSSLVWEEYLRNVCGEDSPRSIRFRDKSDGWKNYYVVIEGERGTILKESVRDNAFMQFYLRGLCSRPSCHNCRYKCGRSGSDIILADFWGVSASHPEMDDDKGTSIVIINTVKGMAAVDALPFKSKEISYEEATFKNTSLLRPAAESAYSQEFWGNFFSGGMEASLKVLRHFRPSRLKSYYLSLKHKFTK